MNNKQNYIYIEQKNTVVWGLDTNYDLQYPWLQPWDMLHLSFPSLLLSLSCVCHKGTKNAQSNNKKNACD